jgi:tRNA(His) 5'-end guanylyltransferase
LLRTSQSDKHDLLFANGINFDALPAWQKRGFGMHWADVEKSGLNLKTGEPTITQRRNLQLDFELPMGDAYANAIQRLLTGGDFVA